MNSPRWKAVDKVWKRRGKAYRKNLKRILPALNPQGKRFFRDALILHDGTLIRLETGDHVAVTHWRTRKFRWNDREVTVRFLVLSDIGDNLFTIEYKQVTSANLNFPGNAELFPVGRFPNFGDWGYDELTLTRKGVFRHEILFSSGATISIEFRRLTFRREPRGRHKKG